MEIIKKLFIIFLGIVLILGVVYIISESYISQEKKTPTKLEEIPDTTISEFAPPDTIREILPRSPIPVQPDTLKWQGLSNGELEPLTGKIPYVNLNSIFTAAAKRILPAVVTIRSEITKSSIPKNEDHHFFWERRDEDDQEPDFFRRGTGSGIIITKEGHILTNYHVVEKASSFDIILYDKREFEAQYIGGDPNTDIALLKIQGDNLPGAYIGNSDSVEIGEWVMAVGSPLNFTLTITAGVVSALGRNIRIIDTQYSIENFIQTDAVINPGNSGGALVNLNGEVIGVNTAIATRTGLYQGYGFAIPINFAIKIVNDILKYGEVRRGLLGVSISNVDNRVAKGVGLSRPTGVLIQGLQSGKAAEKAGLKAGDIILSVNGEEIASVNDLQVKIASKPPGETVMLKVWRNKKELSFRVELGQAPSSRTSNRSDNDNTKKSYKNLGMEIRDLDEEELDKFNIESGIYVTEVKLGSPAHKSGIFPNIIIYEFDGKPILDKEDFEERLKECQKGDVIKLRIRPTIFQNQIDDRILFVEIE